jgi:hypothetical protein
MANDLTVIIEPPQQMLSLPACLAWLVNTLGTTQWPGEAAQPTLMSGVTVSDHEREVAQTRLEEIQTALNPEHPDRPTCYRARLSLLTKMLLAYSAGGSSEQAAAARGEAYLDAVSDFPPWAIGAAIKRWNRGQCGGLGFDPNYAWAPAPAHLRIICRDELAVYVAMEVRMTRLLTAVPIAEATKTAADFARVVETQNQFQAVAKETDEMRTIGGHAKRVLAEIERAKKAKLDA